MISTVFSLVFLGVVGLIVLAIFSPAIYRKIRAKGLAIQKKVAKKISNPTEEAELILLDAEKDIKEHQNKLVTLIASQSTLEGKLDHYKNESIKWQKVAESAKKNNDVTDVTTALSRKLTADKQVEALSVEVKKTEEIIVKIQEFIRVHKERILDARHNVVNLNARQQVVQLRELLVKDTGSSDGLAALSELEQMVVDSEHEVNAREVVFGTEDLETKYTSNVELDEKVKQFMNN